MTEASIATERFSLTQQTRLGYGVVGVVAVFLLGWGGFAQISGAVVAPGRVSVESSVKRIQHKEGGIVQDILVREGQMVKAGQVLLRLDSTVPQANQSVIDSQIMQLTARKQRLEAERDGRAGFMAPTNTALPPNIQAIFTAEQKLMASRSQLRQQQKSQLAEQIRRTEQETSGLKVQVISVSRQNVLIAEELEGLRELHKQGFAPLSRVNQFERQAEALNGEKGDLEARIAQAGTQASALRLQILQVDSGALSEIMTELKDTETRLAQLKEQKITAEDTMRRVEIKTPVTGKVQALNVHTRSGVISPAEALMTIVPDQDALIIEARVDPRHVDQVQQGSKAHIRFTSFATQSTPEATGRLDSLSSDVQTDDKTGTTYYVARMTIAGDRLPKALRDKLISGMPVEVQIETSKRNALSYFFKPLSDQFNRAFREE